MIEYLSDNMKVTRFEFSPVRRVELLKIEWRRWSQFRAVVCIWETFNDLMKNNKKAFCIPVRKKILDGAGRQDELYVRTKQWVEDNWSDWGEKWIKFLEIAKNNAVLQGKAMYRQNKKATKGGKPYTPISLSWLFGAFGNGGDWMVDRVINGELRNYDIDPVTGKFKRIPDNLRPYEFDEDASADEDNRMETWGDPDYYS